MPSNRLSRRDFVKDAAVLSAAAFGSSLPVPRSAAARPSVPPGTVTGEFPEKSSSVMDPEEFRNPGTEYRGVGVLFLNDRLDIDEALRQLRLMRYAGWGRVILRRYSGLLDTPYEEKWNQILRRSLEACEPLTMKVFLQEGNVPFPGQKPEHGHKMLVRRPANEELRENETLITKDGNYAYYMHLDFQSVGSSTAFRKIDPLDADAMDAYLDALFGYLHQNFGYAFGKTIDAIWVDEPEARRSQGLPADSVPWSPKLPGLFEKEWGYSLLQHLPSLFMKVGDYGRVRHQYWRTVCGLFSDTYWRMMGERCERYGLKFSGHQYGEDSLERQMHHTINAMPHYEYMQRPGIDHLTGSLHWPSGDPFILPPKQASSAANQLGKEEVLCEMYGVSDAGTTFEDRKWIFQWLAALGINYRCYHGAFYSLRGHRKRVWPMTMNYQQPFWEENRKIADFAARLSYALRQGEYLPEILVIHPMESYYIDPVLENSEPVTTGPLNNSLQRLSENLLGIQRLFDYGDETLMAKYGRTDGACVVIGRMRYGAVLLPSLVTLRSTTVSLLNAFIDNGGTVLSAGELPVLIDGMENPELTKLTGRIVPVQNTAEELKNYLERVMEPAVTISAGRSAPVPSVWVQVRKLGNGKLIYLTNVDRDKSIEADVWIKGKGKAVCLNLDSGLREGINQNAEGGYVVVRLPFAPASSHLLFLDEEAEPELIPVMQNSTPWTVDIAHFAVSRQDPNSLTLDFCRYRKDAGEWSEVLPCIGVQEILTEEKYSGPVALRYAFGVEAVPARCSVVIEEAALWNIRVNGVRVFYRGLPYYRDKSFHPVEIAHLIRRGENIIELSREFNAPDESFVDDPRQYGTELEPVYIIGDFGVEGAYLGTDRFECVRHRYSPLFSITGEKGSTSGDLLRDGYCFFNGTLSLSGAVNLPRPGESDRIYLELWNLNAQYAKVRVNNREAGMLAWHPYKMDITAFLWEGENKIEIELTTSLRNLIGENHYVPVPASNPWPYKFSGRQWDGRDWLEKRAQGKTESWSDDYFFRPFGLEGRVSVVCERHSV